MNKKSISAFPEAVKKSLPKASIRALLSPSLRLNNITNGLVSFLFLCLCTFFDELLPKLIIDSA